MTGADRFKQAAEVGDLDQMIAAFAEDAVLHSPITFHPFEGRAAIRRLLGILFEVFQEFHYTDELSSPDGTKALIFRVRVKNRDAEGLDLIRLNEAGLIRDFTVMIRPRSALDVLLQEVGSRLVAAGAGVS